MADGSAGPRPGPVGPVDCFDRSLLVHCGPAQIAEAVAVADQPGSGLVVTASADRRQNCLDQARRLVRSGRFGHPLLLDAGRYAGAGRCDARTPFSDWWIDGQRELGLPVLTDSGYVAAGDAAGLWHLLQATARLGDAIALLPLHISWLTGTGARRTLTRYVALAGVPVALVLEHPADPFAEPGAVEGLLEVLDCGVPVLLLRCDVSALGALCCGATAAAVGTVPALRHLYPVPPVPGPAPRVGRPSAIVGRCLAYRRTDVIARTRALFPEAGLWTCDCETCDGRDLSWLDRQPQHRRSLLAFRHSLRVLYALRDDIFRSSLPNSRLSWHARCRDAIWRHADVRWPVPGMLRRWETALPALPVTRLARLDRSRPVGVPPANGPQPVRVV
ncbi:hypothetical protein [Micromonospora echinofusca]|uniref:tRNA-guanine family transglycosylase n=1 Tax=Micromonospora echinofusca TaxID=47858 RepID=A0ABS3VXN0_MICEH|nr:hypothetical protein [Micromonospora echinofusca]MBO4209302.1 hypothetical protein [Micromonospora echinofusca]